MCKLVLSSHHVGPRDPPVGLCGEHFHVLSHLTGPFHLLQPSVLFFRRDVKGDCRMAVKQQGIRIGGLQCRGWTRTSKNMWSLITPAAKEDYIEYRS